MSSAKCRLLNIDQRSDVDKTCTGYLLRRNRRIYSKERDERYACPQIFGVGIVPPLFSLRYFAANLVTNSVLVRCEIKQTKCTKFQNRWGSASADHIRIAYCAPETQRLVGVATQSRKQKVGLRHPHFVAHSDASAQRCQCCGIQNKFARKAL